MLEDKSPREIAVDLYGADRVAADWYNDGWMRAAVRRRLAAGRALLDGGYLDLAAGRARPPRRNSNTSRDIAGTAAGGGASSSPAAEDGGRPAEPGTPATTVARRYMVAWHAAAYLGISESLLNSMRVSGKGPRYAKLGERVVYDVEDLDTWVEARKRRSTGEVQPG